MVLESESESVLVMESGEVLEWGSETAKEGIHYNQVPAPDMYEDISPALDKL